MYGSYAISQGSVTAGSNYNITYVPANLVIGPAVSGSAGIVGVTLSYTDGILKTATSDVSGNYSLIVSNGWSGAVTPSKPGYAFTPASRVYASVTADVTAQDYTPHPTVTVSYPSVAASDGWILETGENTNVGGILNAVSTTFNLGDDATRKQYRAILSFNTGALPDNAVITGAVLKLRRQSITGGGNPFVTFQGLYIDVRKGFFGTAASLQATDFQAAATKINVGPFIPVPAGTLYTISLPGSAYASINKAATNGAVTQLRLRFKLDDNNNALANFISFFSGSAPAANRPVLVITYYLP